MLVIISNENNVQLKEMKHKHLEVSDDVMLIIFEYLTNYELCICELVCKSWHKILPSSYIWKRRFVESYVEKFFLSTNIQNEKSLTWKQKFMTLQKFQIEHSRAMEQLLKKIVQLNKSESITMDEDLKLE